MASSPMKICPTPLIGRDVHENYTEKALADVAQWIECWPTNRNVAPSIPGQVICLCCRPGPRWEKLKK